MHKTKDGNVYNLDAIYSLRRVVGKNEQVYHWMDTPKEEAILVSPDDFYELSDVLVNEQAIVEHYKRVQRIHQQTFLPDPPTPADQIGH
jgi:hypothetical protein